jgi:hypothetical protein
MYGDLPNVQLAEGKEAPGVTFRVNNPPKTAVLRLPTAEEIYQWLRSKKFIRRSLGRRKSQTERVPNHAADLALFKSIRIDSGEPFDEYEASNAIAKITRADVTNCEPNGDGFKITVTTNFGETVHYLGYPTAKILNDYRRGALTGVDLPHGQEELVPHAEVGVALYDSVILKTEGYASGVQPPPHHKSAAAPELVQAIDDLDPEFSPN